MFLALLLLDMFSPSLAGFLEEFGALLHFLLSLFLTYQVLSLPVFALCGILRMTILRQAGICLNIHDTMEILAFGFDQQVVLGTCSA